VEKEGEAQPLGEDAAGNDDSSKAVEDAYRWTSAGANSSVPKFLKLHCNEAVQEGQVLSPKAARFLASNEYPLETLLTQKWVEKVEEATPPAPLAPGKTQEESADEEGAKAMIAKEAVSKDDREYLKAKTIEAFEAALGVEEEPEVAAQDKRQEFKNKLKEASLSGELGKELAQAEPEVAPQDKRQEFKNKLKEASLSGELGKELTQAEAVGGQSVCKGSLVLQHDAGKLQLSYSATQEMAKAPAQPSRLQPEDGALPTGAQEEGMDAQGAQEEGMDAQGAKAVPAQEAASKVQGYTEAYVVEPSPAPSEPATLEEVEALATQPRPKLNRQSTVMSELKDELLAGLQSTIQENVKNSVQGAVQGAVSELRKEMEKRDAQADDLAQQMALLSRSVSTMQAGLGAAAGGSTIELRFASGDRTPASARPSTAGDRTLQAQPSAVDLS
jgi:hypothetical protein